MRIYLDNLYRFGVMLDWEGYRPEFFKEMWDKRIACYTYKKYADDTRPKSEFFETEVTLPSGEVVTMKRRNEECIISVRNFGFARYAN